MGGVLPYGKWKTVLELLQELLRLIGCDAVCTRVWLKSNLCKCSMKAGTKRDFDCDIEVESKYAVRKIVELVL